MHLPEEGQGEVLRGVQADQEDMHRHGARPRESEEDQGGEEAEGRRGGERSGGRSGGGSKSDFAAAPDCGGEGEG